MKLIVVSGLPCTGKSSIAEALATKYSIPLFTKDWIEATLRHIALGEEAVDNSVETISEDGYEIMSMLAMRQLKMGQSAILEGVVQKDSLRQRWRKLSIDYDAHWYVIECICSNELLHKERVLNRHRNIPCWHEVTWERVEMFGGIYSPWKERRLVLDSVKPFKENMRMACLFVTSDPGIRLK